MNSDFKILADLLKEAPSEVQGRGGTALTPELREKIERLVRGELDDQQRRQLCAEIVGEDVALGVLARLIAADKPPQAED